MSDAKLKKWRLILGRQSDPEEEVSLAPEETEENAQKTDSADPDTEEEAAEADAGQNNDDNGTDNTDAQGMDEVLEALYDQDRKGELGRSAPNINRWLGDIRNYFPTSVVQIMQRDALERLGLEQMLLEPELLESVAPDVHLVGTILSLKEIMPEQTKETARAVVRKVTEELQKKLEQPLLQAVRGALSRSVRNHRPKFREIDWHRTVRANLKHYQKEYETVIPERLIGQGRKGNSLKHVILLTDQSGSMASSVVYASVCGAILATLRSVRTHFVVFDTEVVDLTEYLHDPVDLLFGTQLGGGTDIRKALAYAQTLVNVPTDTVIFLISDLYEGGSESEMLQRAAALKESGAQVISLLALSDAGAPMYDKENAERMRGLNIPVFACTPDKFADLTAAAINGTEDFSFMR